MPLSQEERDRIRSNLFGQQGAEPRAEGVKSDFVSRMRQELEAKAQAERAKEIEDRGTMADILMSVPRGAIGATELGLRAVRAASGATTPGTEIGPTGELAGKGIEAIENYKKGAAWTEGKDKWIPQGVEQATQSILSGLPGMALGGAVGGLPGAIIGFATTGGTMFGMAQYDDVIRRADEAGIKREVSEPAAMRSAVYEGGFEMLSDVIEASLWGMGKPLTIPAKQVAKEGIQRLFRIGFKDIVKKTAATAVAETSTEMVTSGLQAEEERKLGLGDQRFWDAAKAAFGPSFVASVIFSGFWGGSTGLDLRKSRKALEDPNTPPADRMQVALAVENSLRQIDPIVAQVWGNAAHQAIEDGQPISLSADALQNAPQGAPATDVSHETPTVDIPEPEEELPTVPEEQLDVLDQQAQNQLRIDDLQKKISNLSSIKNPSAKQAENLAAYRNELDALQKGEINYDTQGEGGLPSAEREWQEPGWSVQDECSSKQ